MRRDLRSEKVLAGIKKGDSAVVFDWLMAALSYQGISDQVAYDYMQAHGRATWRDIEHGIAGDASCPKLASYWHFHDCRYEKSSRTCTQPDHINDCPLPCHDLRNGHLNQLAYSLFLFIRDLADGDLVGWKLEESCCCRQRRTSTTGVSMPGRPRGRWHIGRADPSVTKRVITIML